MINLMPPFVPLPGEVVGKILFNAFSFLQKKLAEKGKDYANSEIEVPEGCTVLMLIKDLGLEENDVEGSFFNGKVKSLDTVLNQGDRVAIFPPGTPGPYRLLLGIIDSSG